MSHLQHSWVGAKDLLWPRSGLCPHLPSWELEDHWKTIKQSFKLEINIPKLSPSIYMTPNVLQEAQFKQTDGALICNETPTNPEGREEWVGDLSKGTFSMKPVWKWFHFLQFLLSFSSVFLGLAAKGRKKYFVIRGKHNLIHTLSALENPDMKENI